MVDYSAMQLGKLPARHDARTLRLAKYLPKALAEPPETCDWTTAVGDFEMFMNDQIGDCGLASPGHYLHAVSAANGSSFKPTDEQIVRAYKDVGGYVPGNPETDRGIYLLDGMNYWRQKGIAGRVILAFARLDLRNRLQFKQGIHGFGGLIAGFNLPETSQAQEEWRLRMGGDGRGLDPTPGSWGGHAVFIGGYGPRGVLIVTWKFRKWVSWDFLDACCDEAFAVVSPDWADFDGTPNGFATEDLLADLGRIAA